MTVTEYSIETHDHPHITRRQKLKLHAANGVAITCYCLHEQHKHSAQADDALNRVSGSHCSLRTPTSARLLIDKTSSWTRLTLIKVVEDVAFGAHWPCQTMGRGLCAKIRAGSSPRASREPLVASADEPSVEGEKSCSFPHGGPLRLPPPCLALLADRRQWSRCRSRRPSASLATRAHAVVADSNNQPNSNTPTRRHTARDGARSASDSDTETVE